MDDRLKMQRVIELSVSIHRLETKAGELRIQLARIMGMSDDSVVGDVEELLRDVDGLGDAMGPRRSSGQPTRRSSFPEGPPLNRKIMEFLRSTSRPVGYQDIMGAVPAHHQSIQNALRDLEARGLAVKLGPNQWMPFENHEEVPGARRK